MKTRTYECMCLLDNREVRKGWQPLKDAVAGVFNKHGARILSARRWDERRLAYAIKGQQRGTYLLEGAADQARGSLWVVLEVVVHLVAAYNEQLGGSRQVELAERQGLERGLGKAVTKAPSQHIHALRDGRQGLIAEQNAELIVLAHKS